MTQLELDNATLNQLAQSGSHLRLYSAQDAARTTEKLSRHTAFSVVSEQLKTRSGETDLDAAIAQQKAGLRTPAEQAIHLAIPLLESEKLTFSRPQLLATALETGGREGSDGGHRHNHSGTNQVGAVAECTGGARPRQ
ncbi:hypothetical protein LN650_31620 [Klebsiella pneumoniae subsp. pneumoniae]|nr:hypothetical protein [Klebsiella pneumoniae subsp. pneumoniae]